jgi:trans-2-enoyl-CoA reductase
MGGPIVRTGTTPAFWQNWDKAFGKPKKSLEKRVAALEDKLSRSGGGKKASAKKSTSKKPAKNTKAKPAGKAKKKKK